MATLGRGMLITNDREIYERAVAFGHYERTGGLTLPKLKRFAGLPLGGVKHRMHQMSSAVGRVQLKHYKKRMAEIQKAMNLFCDLIDGGPGIRGHRPPKDSGSVLCSTRQGSNFPHCLNSSDLTPGRTVSRRREPPPTPF